MKLLQSKWIASSLGLILYLLTTVLCWHPQRAAETDSAERPAKIDGPSWTFQNPEIDQLIGELKHEREALTEKEKQLNELSARLLTERQELNQLTQNVHALQVEFDKNVTRIQEQEAGNLKKLAKLYAGMAPENAVPILRQMDEGTLVKIFGSMRDAERGPLLEMMGSRGESDAKLAANLSERLRLVVPNTTTSISR
ncbi:MAG: hypothetical protein U1G07_01605 [Verrucomicrobiota bacterium]